MTTYLVWVCILWTGHNHVVIDNIASRENCHAIAAAGNGLRFEGACILVRKVKP